MGLVPRTISMPLWPKRKPGLPNFCFLQVLSLCQEFTFRLQSLGLLETLPKQPAEQPLG